WQSIVLAFQQMVLDRDVLALHGAGFVEAFTERSANARGARGPLGADECNGRRRRLLGTSRKRPCDPCACRPAEQRHHLAPVHSITSSARSNNDSGIVIPMALATRTLTISSNLVGACIGSSAGFVPLNIRST